MLEFFLEYGLFFAKVITVLAAILIVIASIFSSSSKSKSGEGSDIQAKHLNKILDETKEQITQILLSKEEAKLAEKAQKKKDKEEAKALKKKAKGQSDDETPKPKIFVLNFDGDKEGSEVESLRQEVTALLLVASKHDEVLVRVESPGGMVHTYGLAAAQLERIKNAGIKLTISVDKVAASGGYLMACIADHLIAAPFAIVGSVGVLVEITNFNRLLKKNNVDVEILTAGEHKHTISMLGEITPAAREKTILELAAVHSMFKEFVSKYRPQLDIEKVATGEYWHGSQAIELKMVDELMTSDEYLCKLYEDKVDVYELGIEIKENLADRLGFSFSLFLERFGKRLLQRLNKNPLA